MEPSRAASVSSGEPETILAKSSNRSSGLILRNSPEIAYSALRSVCVFTAPTISRPVRTALSPYCRVPYSQPSCTIFSMVGEKSEMAVAPRGSASSAVVMSLARREASSAKCLKMRCRSLSLAWINWCSQCTSSTYGLPLSLQKTVAPSMPL